MYGGAGGQYPSQNQGYGSNQQPQLQPAQGQAGYPQNQGQPNLGSQPGGFVGSPSQGLQPGGFVGSPSQGLQPGGFVGSPSQGLQPGGFVGSPSQGLQPGGFVGSPSQGLQPGGYDNNQQAPLQGAPGQSSTANKNPPIAEDKGFCGRLFSRDTNTQDQGTPDANQPGFFGRMFGKKATETPPPDPNAPQNLNAPPIVEPANGARCLGSKPLPPEEVDAIRSQPLNPSKWNFLNGEVKFGQQGVMHQTRQAVMFTPQAGAPPEVTTYGPCLRFGGYDPATRSYFASILAVAYQTKSPQPPTLYFRDINVPKSETSVPAEHLDHFMGFNFFRFNLAVECGVPQRVIEYWVKYTGDNMFQPLKRYRFHVPGIGQKWHWGFYSCNGFHDPDEEREYGGIQPLWNDVLHCHATHPIHVMVGGGDQLYNDNIWNLPAMVQWVNIPDKATRLAYPFTQEMVDQVFWCYFTNYLKHWSQPMFF